MVGVFFMLNCNWVIPGGTLETGARCSACGRVAPPFGRVFPLGKRLSERGRFIKGVTRIIGRRGTYAEEHLVYCGDLDGAGACRQFNLYLRGDFRGVGG